MSEQRWLIQAEPQLTVVGSDFDRPAKATVSSLVLDIGEVQVDMDKANLPHDPLISGILASVGMPYEEIAEKVFLTQGAIKKHVHSLVDTTGIAGRPGLARYFFETGTFTYREPRIAALTITARERDILEQVSYGKTNEQVGTALGISPSTVKGLCARMAGRTDWRGRERLAFAGLAGGNIGNFALHGAEVLVAAGQTILLGGQADEGARMRRAGLRIDHSSHRSSAALS
jgi:DNA-binding CsgD family transcriptional regulator